MRTTWKTVTTFAALIAASAFLASCEKKNQGTPAANSGAGAQKSYVIGVIAKSGSNAVFKAAHEGAKAAARDLEEAHGIKINIDWRTPAVEEDAQLQAQYVEQLAAAGADGIAISATNADILRGAVDSAVDQGTQVMTFDSDVPDSNRFAYFGVEDKAAGAAVMRELARILEGEGVVAVLAGNQAATNLQARVSGVREEAAKHEGIEIREVYYHAEDPASAVAKMQSVQTSNPDITGWALVGGWPLYTDNALAGIHENAAVVSMDPLRLPLAYLQKGEVQALVGQPYFGWGYESVRMIIDKIHFKKDPPSEMNYATFDIVTQENADEYLANWDKWDPGS